MHAVCRYMTLLVSIPFLRCQNWITNCRKTKYRLAHLLKQLISYPTRVASARERDWCNHRPFVDRRCSDMMSRSTCIHFIQFVFHFKNSPSKHVNGRITMNTCFLELSLHLYQACALTWVCYVRKTTSFNIDGELRELLVENILCLQLRLRDGFVAEGRSTPYHFLVIPLEYQHLGTLCCGTGIWIGCQPQLA